jgi:hypothetical protein
MVDKYLITYTKESSFDSFNNSYLKQRKADILFFESKLDEFNNICLSFNSDNTPKVVISFSQLVDLNSKIMLLSIDGDNLKNKEFVQKNIADIGGKLNNRAIIRINKINKFYSSLEHVIEDSNQVFDIFGNLISNGLSGEIYFFQNDGKVIYFEIKNLFNELNYDLTKIDKAIKVQTLELKNFLTQNNLLKDYDINDIEILQQTNFFNEKNQKFYLNNYFLSEEFNLKNQIKNPDSFKGIYLEICNFIKSQTSQNNQIIQSFIEICLFDYNATKATPTELSSIVKKIKVIALNFDKVSDSVKSAILNSFLKGLENEKSSNLIVFFMAVFFENIILSDSKRRFLEIIYENDLFLNKAIDLKQVFSKKIEIIYPTLFLSNNYEYSFSEPSAIAYFDNVDKEILKITILAKIKSFNPLNLIFKKSFLSEIIENSSYFFVKNLAEFVEKNFDDIEKNKFRDAISSSIFSQDFINYSADKVKILYRLLPKEIQQKLPADFAPKKKSGMFD